MDNGNLLRVTRIRVENLFNRYSHDIALNLNERATIIHGPNGAGKTVLLRLTAALFSGRFEEFTSVPFSSFGVTLSDDSVCKVHNTDHIFSIEFTDAAGETHNFPLPQIRAEILKLANSIERESPFLARYGPELFIDRNNDEILTPEEVFREYSEALPEHSRTGKLFPEPEWLSQLRSRVRVHLVETQRLFRLKRPRGWDAHRTMAPFVQPRYIETVKEYARDLHQRISKTLATYAEASQSLDQSFPERLLRTTTWSANALSIEALQNRMQQLEDKRQQIKQIGLIGDDTGYPFNVSALANADNYQRAVMTLYVDDTAKKLGVLDDIISRLNLLRDKTERKFQNKTISISKDKGFEAIAQSGEHLQLGALSSGEQHELVLFYDLLFKVKSNALVLIDEPELSLHVAWQKSFLPDILEIVSTAHFDVLMATHSPFIVGDRTDLMRPLLTESLEPQPTI